MTQGWDKAVGPGSCRPSLSWNKMSLSIKDGILSGCVGTANVTKHTTHILVTRNPIAFARILS